jgi:hypothetical protein
MKTKNIILCIVCMIALAACSNDTHAPARFVKGIAITRTADLAGVYMQVDTNFDGNADLATDIIGQSMTHKFSKGDTVSVEIYRGKAYSTPVLTDEPVDSIQ